MSIPENNAVIAEGDHVAALAQEVLGSVELPESP
jgi:hypothetical protein